VIDLRWLAPLNEQGLLDAIAGCGKVLIVDECRRTGSQSEALMALFAERAPEGRSAPDRGRGQLHSARPGSDR
jgi:2-oxoisovalerate dehydrogenase E1 component